MTPSARCIAPDVSPTTAPGSPAARAWIEKDLSTPSDVWSFGVMLYEAVSRKRPFVADNGQASIIAIATEAPRPLQSIAPDVPAPFCEAIHSALRKDPAARPTMRAFIEQLKAAIALDDTQALTLRCSSQCTLRLHGSIPK